MKTLTSNYSQKWTFHNPCLVPKCLTSRHYYDLELLPVIVSANHLSAHVQPNKSVYESTATTEIRRRPKRIFQAIKLAPYSGVCYLETKAAQMQ